jgi:hypothetical protein
LWATRPIGTVPDMTDSTLQSQLDEVRVLLARARELFGDNLIGPPADIAPAPDSAQRWVR